ncbi:MAG: hypothetical protein K9G12_04550, partial [Candidatus Nanopelagicales bacterium]|nr:hypothetical protein [Candidatus Nanopelagicales bacterium]
MVAGKIHLITLPIVTESLEIPEQVQIRMDKRAELLERGMQAYPVSLPIDSTITEVRAAHGHLEAEQSTGVRVGLAGRVIFSRNTGKLCFATLTAGNGDTIQAMVSLAEVGEQSLADWKSLVDLGDYVFVHGEVITP